MPCEPVDLGNGVRAILCGRGRGLKKKGHSKDEPRRLDGDEEHLILEDVRRLQRQGADTR